VTLNEVAFQLLCQRSLVYNACWEDPALDRQALNIEPDDACLVITSAGCNVLDYALCGPRHIYAVDVNPCQNALLELRLSGIRNLDHEAFFQIFGRGSYEGFADLYRRRLRADLSPFARGFWDSRLGWFTGDGIRKSFYLHGLTGWIASFFQGVMRARPRLRDGVERFLAARTIAEQREAYDQRIGPALWTPIIDRVISSQLFMSMMAVPAAQTAGLGHERGPAGYIRAAVDRVFRDVPIGTNYFWQLYMRGGSYPEECCPRYLTKAGFLALQRGLADRISIESTTVTEFLARNEVAISKYVLLDHMDWMGAGGAPALTAEWTQILRRAAPKARAIFRSVHAEPVFLRSVRVPQPTRDVPLMDLLQFDRPLASRLHELDRVGTYRGFHIADFGAQVS
jgi:S-adenosylmethionine-diacylglycerol 3-amino-3-carboxypropyl transferase